LVVSPPNIPPASDQTDRSFEFEITTTGDPGWTNTWGMSHLSVAVAHADDTVSKNNTATGARIESPSTARFIELHNPCAAARGD